MFFATCDDFDWHLGSDLLHNIFFGHEVLGGEL
jgi:hypothetical protein